MLNRNDYGFSNQQIRIEMGKSFTDDICQIKEVWTKCFNDSEKYFDSFLNRFYLPECMITCKIENKIVSLFCIVPCTSALGNTAYLFGLATLPEYRRKGYGSKVVYETLKACGKMNFDEVVLIPGEKKLKDYYSKFDFIDANIHLSFTTDFDLGTGDSSKNIAMILSLKTQNTNHYPRELICKPCHEFLSPLQKVYIRFLRLLKMVYQSLKFVYPFSSNSSANSFPPVFTICPSTIT